MIQGWSRTDMATRKLDPGMTVFVRYVGDDLWHERLLLARVGTSLNVWVICTPDNDLYTESFGNSNDDVDGFRFGTPANVLPPGVPPGRAYRFNVLPTGAALAHLKAEAETLAEAESFRMGDEKREDEGWNAIEDSEGVKRGDKVNLTANSVTVDDKALRVEVEPDGSQVVTLCVRVKAVDV